MPFDDEYFLRQYARRPWRARGEKPVLDKTRVRWLKNFVSSGVALEIGSGYGALARTAAHSYRVIGLDLDYRVLTKAFGNTDVAGVAGSAYALPIRDGSVDLVLCMDVLEHLAQPETCLTEIRRVLRPGGFVFLSTPNPSSLGARRKGNASFIYRDPTHCSVLPMSVWKQKLRDAGLREVWSGTDMLWDSPYVSWIPRRLQWLLFTLGSQVAWAIAPAFRWELGENFVWLGQRPK